MQLIARCQEFRRLLASECLMIPGCFNGLIARLAAQHGFKAVYISGGALTASSGVPDIGLRTLPEFCSVIKDVSMFSNLPVIVDADTGFGEGEMCARTVSDFFYSGAAGLHIEDQVFPKRCGHLGGKDLISTQQMIDKIKNFETVLNAHYPTVSDIRMRPYQRKLIKKLSGVRYRNSIYTLPYELKVLQKIWGYRQPEIQGF